MLCYGTDRQLHVGSQVVRYSRGRLGRREYGTEYLRSTEYGVRSTQYEHGDNAVPPQGAQRARHSARPRKASHGLATTILRRSSASLAMLVSITIAICRGGFGAYYALYPHTHVQVIRYTEP